ncbi:hypothetical protein CR513_37545, partial [Mucuna pruriens]
MRRSGIEGLPLSYLEEKMNFFSENGNWDGFINILGLAIYEIVLLPHLNDYVDLTAIDVFLANRERGRSFVVAVLANTYYTMQYCHEGRGGRLQMRHQLPNRRIQVVLGVKEDWTRMGSFSLQPQ